MPLIQENSNNLSVMEVVRKGKSTLLFPRILFTFGLILFVFIGWMFFTILSNATLKDAGFVSKFGLFWIVTFIPFNLLPFWFWSRRTTRWKLWAFNNVNNVHELKHFARRAALYANYGSFLDRITIQTKTEREQWAKLQSKFKRTDVFEDDVEVPAETVVYYSTAVRLLNIIFFLVIGGIGFFITQAAFNPRMDKWVALPGIGIMVWMLYLLFTMIRDVIQHKPQMILSNKGIETIKDGLQSWDVIFNEHLTPGNRRDMGWILRYNYAGGSTRIDIGHYAINHENLDHLLMAYRGRYNEGKRKTH
ncbi:hypothetical protein MUGA111182_14810 [Mucilaginibacter galii]|uniref:Uncharacterized protein n=1 Tax=Mucilaginibacter galii TaxID=2005073 RepID=A0A917N0R7_9SPHI|nr:hypothetical protein [Mucilaginibacter galii]GGI50103.1 hypothetical protein GCM10011425_13150 [Mucilaginibacter galii]